MKKLNFLTILLSALLVSGSVWGGTSLPEIPVKKKALDWSKMNIERTLQKGVAARKSSLSNPVEIVGKDSFPSLYDAIVAAEDGDVIRLLDSVADYGMTIDKSITIDLCNKKLSNPYIYSFTFYISGGKNVTIKNGIIDVDSYYYFYGDGDNDWDYTRGIYVYDTVGNALITIDSVSFIGSGYAIYNGKGKLSIANSDIAPECGCVFADVSTLTNTSTTGENDIYSSVTINGGTHQGYQWIWNPGHLIVKSGSFTSTSKWGPIAAYDYATYGATSVTIEGGEFNNENSSCYGTVYGYNCNLSISGGTFRSATYVITSSYGQQLSVIGGKFYKGSGPIFQNGWASKSFTGGAFSTNVGNEVGLSLDDGYFFASEPNKEGLYEVIENQVAMVNGKSYNTLQKAINAANTDDIVTLIADASDTNVTCTKNITLDLAAFELDGKFVADNATVKILGASFASMADFDVSNGGVLKISGGTYTKDPTGYINTEEGYEIIPTTTYTVGRIVAKIGEIGYYSIQSAVEAAEGSEALIEMQYDYDVEGSIHVLPNQFITLDLNGYVVSCSRNADGAFELVRNQGHLTIQDKSDVKKNGSGTGKITSCSYKPDYSMVPGYATNVIKNEGVLTLLSGTVETSSLGHASYAIDNDSRNATPLNNEMVLNIKGGKVVGTEGANAFVIRLYTQLNNKTVAHIENATISGLWVQVSENDANVGILTMKNVVVQKNLYIGYTAQTKAFTTKLENITIENGTMINELNYSNYVVGDSTLYVRGSRIKDYRISYPYKHLMDGQYQFKEDVKVETRHFEDLGDFPESEGYYYVPTEGQPAYRDIYRYAQAFMRDFVQNIEDGYYLRLMDGEDGANLWYEIVKLKATNPDLPEESGLGHPWHRDTTWDSDSTNVVPKDTDAVLIDHNVYVENDSVATANSIVVASGDTLRILSGGVLHVGGAGINLEDETAEVIVEPDAILTVGAAGVIADSVQNIVIESSGDTTGIFLLNPDVDINTQPKGTVEMVAHVGKRNGNNVWHRFALPVVKLDAAWTKEPSRSTYLYEWSYTEKSWVLTEGGSLGMKPFFGYTISTDYPVENVKYTFIGNLLGNQGSNIDFTHIGYGYFGNSYTGHIYAQTLLNDVFELEGVEGTVWMWNTANQSYSGVSLEDYSGSAAEDLEDFEKNVSPMQTFILKLNSGDGTNMDIDYAAAIWGNPRYGLVEANAPSRKEKVQNDAYANIIITSANGNSDKVRLTESAKYSDEYENGIDAPKYMNSGSINLYVTADGGDFTSLYSNNLQGKRLTLKTLDEVSYTLTIGHVEGGKYAIKDLLTNKVVAMENNATYTFAAQPNTTMERFEIVEARQLPTSVDQVQDFKETNGIYSILGQYIGETSNWEMLPKGVYVVDGVKLVK